MVVITLETKRCHNDNEGLVSKLNACVMKIFGSWRSYGHACESASQKDVIRLASLDVGPSTAVTVNVELGVTVMRV